MLQTQDVAVDGWALTMLKPKNVGYASTCNSVGQVDSLLMFFLTNLQQTTGWCLGYILFLTMEGAGLVTLGGCLENYHSSTHDFTHTHKIIKMNQVNFSFSGALSSL